MITIRIDGAPGEGKTTTALRIARYLRSLGFAVEYRGRVSEVEARQSVGPRDPDIADLLLWGQPGRMFEVRDEG